MKWWSKINTNPINNNLTTLQYLYDSYISTTHYALWLYVFRAFQSALTKNPEPWPLILTICNVHKTSYNEFTSWEFTSCWWHSYSLRKKACVCASVRSHSHTFILWEHTDIFKVLSSTCVEEKWNALLWYIPLPSCRIMWCFPPQMEWKVKKLSLQLSLMTVVCRSWSRNEVQTLFYVSYSGLLSFFLFSFFIFFMFNDVELCMN